MTMISFTRLVALAVLLPMFHAESLGQQLYKWEDAEGRMHYSDRPPTDAATALQKQALPAPSHQAPEDDFYSIENQVKRLEEDRISREEARREAEEKRIEAQKQAADLEAARAQAEKLGEQAENPDYPVYVSPIPPIHRPDRPVRPLPHPIPVPLPTGPVGGGR